MKRVELNSDLLTYLADPSVEKRARIATAVGQYFTSRELSEDDRTWVHEVLQRLMADTQVFVRHAVSVQLCETPLLPNAWALKLAHDVDRVATPVLRHSPVLDDDDLLEVVRAGGERKLLAISERATIADRVGAELVERGSANVVSSLLSNPGADLSTGTLNTALRHHPDDEEVHRGFLTRRDLPPDLLLKLAEQVNAEVRRELIVNYDLPEPIVDQIVKLSEEQAVEFLTEDSDAERERELVGALKDGAKLTDTLLLRTLLEGRFDFFCAGMGARATLSPAQAERQLFHGDAFRRSRLYREAGVAPALFSAFNAAIATAHPYIEGDRPFDTRYQDDALWRIVSAYREIAPGDVNAVLAQLQKHAYETAE